MRSHLRRVLPSSSIRFAQMLRHQWKLFITRRVFELAGNSPEWLDKKMFPILQQKHTAHPDYRFDSETFLKRGKERSQALLALLKPQKERVETFLELGCCDAMVSYSLQHHKKRATAVDLKLDRVDPRAVEAGVCLRTMDATKLDFPEALFDCVFSYNSFEHFNPPELVLKEACRVVRPGGFIYLSFGPLYFSPFGLHSWPAITIPYCHLLFQKEILKTYLDRNKLWALDFDEMNGYSLEQYRSLWTSYANSLRTVFYREMQEFQYLDFIRKYPSCFKSKTGHFDNLIVSGIEVLFQKK